MDPDQALADMREMFDAEIFTDGEWSADTARTRLREFAEKFGNLDDWLRGGGYLPVAWQKQPISEMMRGRPALQDETPARVIERELTVTVTESGWATYRIPVSPDFDPDEDCALVDLISNADEDDLVQIDGAIESRDITLDSDSAVSA